MQHLRNNDLITIIAIVTMVLPVRRSNRNPRSPWRQRLTTTTTTTITMRMFPIDSIQQTVPLVEAMDHRVIDRLLLLRPRQRLPPPIRIRP